MHLVNTTVPIDVSYICATTDITTSKFDFAIDWWSKQTFINEHTVHLSAAEIRNNMVFSVFAIVDGKIVGAAGLMFFPHRNNKEILFLGSRVIEFRANCVIMPDKGIGQVLHKMRIEYVDLHGYHSIMITKHEKIRHIRKKFGWEVLEEVENGGELLAEIRECSCHHDKTKLFVGPRCAVCPYFDKSIFLRRKM